MEKRFSCTIFTPYPRHCLRQFLKIQVQSGHNRVMNRARTSGFAPLFAPCLTGLRKKGWPSLALGLLTLKLFNQPNSSMARKIELFKFCKNFVTLLNIESRSFIFCSPCPNIFNVKRFNFLFQQF